MSQKVQNQAVATLPLLHPVTLPTGESLASVKIYPLKRRDISAAQQHSRDDAVIEDLLLARMTNLTVEDLGELHIADSRRVTETFQEMVRGADVAAFVGRIAAPGTAPAAQ
ncbi:phage tail assembly protein [Alcaligenaceae bacterium]|nr:phage tail assembly protein [Alcaligenaceae bacterium]